MLVSCAWKLIREGVYRRAPLLYGLKKQRIQTGEHRLDDRVVCFLTPQPQFIDPIERVAICIGISREASAVESDRIALDVLPDLGGRNPGSSSDYPNIL